MIQRGGQVVIRMFDNVRRKTIEPILRRTIAPGTLINTDEYGIYNALTEWGYRHQTVNHCRGEYARDDDKDGFCEVHVNTMEGFWSLLRSWLRPHRGLSQECLPLYLGFFAGFLLYIGASDILPEAHSERSSALTILLTCVGAGFVYVVSRIAG